MRISCWLHSDTMGCFKKECRRKKEVRRRWKSKHFTFWYSLKTDKSSLSRERAHVMLYRGKYQAAWLGIKGISAVQRSGDGKRLLRNRVAGRAFISGRQLESPKRQRYLGLKAQWGCSDMTFHIQICHSNGILATFKRARLAFLHC